MRVAIDCHMLGQPHAGDAGNGRYAATLVRALRATRPDGDVRALVAYEVAAGDLGDAPTIPVPAGNVARLARGAPRGLAGSDAALFHYVVPLRAPCPLLVIVHDPSFRMFPEWTDRRTRLLLNTLVPLSVRRARRVIAVSHRVKADIVTALGVDPERIDVVRTAPDPRFHAREGAEARVAERFGLGRYCLAVGDVHPRKNIGALAEAVRRVGGIELALVGTPGHRGQEILGGLTSGRFLGRVTDDELADLYSAAAVTAYPSLYEGFGLPVIEAMACGSPVVASNRGAIPEVAADAALLVEPTPDAIAEGLRAALDPSTSDRLRAAGPLRAAEFTHEATGLAGWAAIERALRA